MDTEFNNCGKRKQLHGGCKRNESRPGRGGKPKCQRCRKARKKCTRSSENVACEWCAKRGLGIRECERSLLPKDDSTPRRAPKKLSIHDPDEIQLVERHRARSAIKDNSRSERPELLPFNLTSDVMPLREDDTNALPFLEAMANSSARDFINNRNLPSATEEAISTSIGGSAEIGIILEDPVWDDNEWEEFLASFFN